MRVSARHEKGALGARWHRRSGRRAPHGAPPRHAPPALPGGPLTGPAEAALPALVAVAAEAAYAVDARAVAAARAVALVPLGLDLALVVVCDMEFGRCPWCRQPPPCPHSGPETPKDTGTEPGSRAHSPMYLDQKASCGEKGVHQGLSAQVCIWGAQSASQFGPGEASSLSVGRREKGFRTRRGQPLLVTSL